MSEINWDEAPNLATHCIDGSFTFWSKGTEYTWEFDEWVKNANQWSLEKYTKNGIFEIIERPTDKWQEGEERMNNIAQNGNDAEHYEQLEGVSATLAERGSRYGSFLEGSNISQSLKDIVRAVPNWDSMDSDKKQSIEFFMDKISRIVNGDSDYIDNWHDISGYAKLVEDRLISEGKK